MLHRVGKFVYLNNKCLNISMMYRFSSCLSTLTLLPFFIYFWLKNFNCCIYYLDVWIVLCTQVFLKTFAKLIGKHLCRSFFFSKVSGLGLQHKPFLLSGDCFCLFSCSMFTDNLIQSLLILSQVKLITSLAHIIWNPDVACGVLILFFTAAKVRCGLIFFAYSQAS